MLTKHLNTLLEKFKEVTMLTVGLSLNGLYTDIKSCIINGEINDKENTGIVVDLIPVKRVEKGKLVTLHEYLDFEEILPRIKDTLPEDVRTDVSKSMTKIINMLMKPYGVYIDDYVTDVDDLELYLIEKKKEPIGKVLKFKWKRWLDLDQELIDEIESLYTRDNVSYLVVPQIKAKIVETHTGLVENPLIKNEWMDASRISVEEESEQLILYKGNRIFLLDRRTEPMIKELGIE